MTIKYAIFGSCATRDALPFIDGQLELACYVARSSLVSAFSSGTLPLALDDEDFIIPNLPGAFERRQLTNDILQRNAELLADDYDALIYDGIDERFRVLRAGTRMITNSSLYLLSPASTKLGELPIEQDGTQFREDLYTDACDKLATTLAGRPLIIHRAFWAETLVDDEGVMRPQGDTDLALVRRNNTKLEKIYDLMEGRVPNSVSIELPAQLRYSAQAHKWGRDFFHYGDDYYQELARRIQDTIQQLV